VGRVPRRCSRLCKFSIDLSDLLTQDGIIGIEVVDDEDSIELMETSYDNDALDEDDEDY
jgi:cell division protein FtsX